jgi:hypothetical protein
MFLVWTLDRSRKSEIRSINQSFKNPNGDHHFLYGEYSPCLSASLILSAKVEHSTLGYPAV